ncbi:MAG: TraR/DksA family transcriptional regulator [Actinomycetota bacterium]
MDQETLNGFRHRLDGEREAIGRQLVDMGIDVDTGAPTDVAFEQGFADSGQATAEKARVLSIGEGLIEQLHEVAGALERIEQGTYGRCENCGKDIPVERLEARPVARLCLDCKKLLG